MTATSVLAVAGAAVVGAILSTYAWLGLARAWQHYRQAFGQDVVARLDDFFLFVDPSRLWAANLTICGALGGITLMMSRHLILAACVAIVALAAPRYLVAYARRRRVRTFEMQLPDLLMSLASALRAGAGLQPALREIVSQSPPPLAQEFALLLRQQRMGVSWDDALSKLAHRMPSEGCRLVVSILGVAARSGGSVADTLDAVALTLRARLHMAGRIQALTSQGRLQAWLMACMPIVLGVSLHALDPEAMRPLWETWAGWTMICLIVVLLAAGLLMVRRIVNIEI